MSKLSARAVSLCLAATAAITTGCSSSGPPISVSVSPSSAVLDQGYNVGINATVANDRANSGVSWSLSGPGSLTSQSGLSVTYNAPTSNVTNPQTATVTATSAKDGSKSASVRVTINPLPQISSQQTQLSGTVGIPYNQTITLSGGTAPFQWSVYNGPIVTGWRVGGAVPDGLTLNANTGAITGTPTAGGTWYFEATVTDASGATAINGFLSIQINSNLPAANPVPFLNSSLAPTSARPGSASLALHVSGTGFVFGASVALNGAPLATTFVDSEHLSAIAPAANLAAARTASITVVNPSPGGGASNAVFFQVGSPEAAVSFANAPNSPLQIAEPFALAVADFNEDGKPDLVVAANVRMYVMLGSGNGTFSPASGSPVSIPSPPYDDFGSPYVGPAIVVGDFNRSGHVGLSVGLFQNQAAVTLFGNGDGTFTYASTLANAKGQPTLSLSAADFNGDGNLDMAVVNDGGVTPIVMLGYSHGAFNNVEQNVQVSGNSSATGDFNGDGKLDLLVDGSVLLGNGDGTFTQGVSLNASGLVTVGDFNGDGKLDFAICNPATNTLTVFLGDGSGNFAVAPGSPLTVGLQPQAITTADFNNDGKLDLAIANYGDATVTLLLGNGDGTFTASAGSPYAVGKNPSAVAAADFNGDGKLDLAVANATDNTVSILLQQ